MKWNEPKWRKPQKNELKLCSNIRDAFKFAAGSIEVIRLLAQRVKLRIAFCVTSILLRFVSLWLNSIQCVVVVIVIVISKQHSKRIKWRSLRTFYDLFSARIRWIHIVMLPSFVTLLSLRLTRLFFQTKKCMLVLEKKRSWLEMVSFLSFFFALSISFSFSQ